MDSSSPTHLAFRFPVPPEQSSSPSLPSSVQTMGISSTATSVPVESNEQDAKYMQDRRVIGYDPLVQPALLRHELPLSASSQRTVAASRALSAQILALDSPMLLVVVGPCSIHDPEQALTYASLLKEKVSSGAWPNLHIVMRAYFEKPRTTVGWKGLINDPDIDGSFKINKGLKIGRQLLCDITEMGIPVGSELLDTISPQYISDLISWGAIGARTTESQLHRELSSGVSFPIGFKNGTDGSIGVAIDAMASASNPHAFMGVTDTGLAAIVKTRGNKDVHVILRGGSKGPNFEDEHVEKAKGDIEKKLKGWKASIMVDCSHGNSQKNHNNQPKVLASICSQLRSGQTAITGVMVESHIHEGRQDVPPEGKQGLKYGVSITDACVEWERTVKMLDDLNEAVGVRTQMTKEQTA